MFQALFVSWDSGTIDGVDLTLYLTKYTEDSVDFDYKECNSGWSFCYDCALSGAISLLTVSLAIGATVAMNLLMWFVPKGKIQVLKESKQ